MSCGCGKKKSIPSQKAIDSFPLYITEENGGELVPFASSSTIRYEISGFTLNGARVLRQNKIHLIPEDAANDFIEQIGDSVWIPEYSY